MSRAGWRLLLTIACLAGGGLAFPQSVTRELRGPEGLRERLVEGKLRLGVAEAVQLVLLNSTDVRLSYLDFDDARYANLGARQVFDPLFVTAFNTQRGISPTTSTLQGAETLDAVGQDGRMTIAQRVPFLGTRYDFTFSGSRADTNSRFSTFNPAYNSDVTLRLTQPLFGHQSSFATRAVVLLAEQTVRESRATLEERLSRAIVGSVTAYWDAVQARESLAVARNSLELAEATYERDKRGLELGALPPLDIHRSESTVATRRLEVIQSEYARKRSEDRLRRLIGADLDPQVAALGLDLTEQAVPSGELLAIIALDPTTDPPTILSRGGFGQSLDQLRSLDFKRYGFSVAVTLPLRNRGAEAELGQARVDRERALYLVREQEQAVTLDVVSAVDDLEKAKQSLSVSRLARDLAQKTLEAEQRKRELGENTLFFVLEAQAGLASAELSYLRAAVEYQQAVTGVARATGTLLERHHVQIAEAGK